MRCERRWVGVVLLPLMLTACGGGEDAGPTERSDAARRGGRLPHKAALVVRYDFDQDDHADVLTLDATQRPLRIVEALQGGARGAFVDATARWRGRSIDAELDAVLHTYLERSLSVASETPLEIQVRGRPVLLSVIE